MPKMIKDFLNNDDIIGTMTSRKETSFKRGNNIREEMSDPVDQDLSDKFINCSA